MVEEQETRRRRPRPESRVRSEERPERTRTREREKIRPTRAASAALEQISELTGREAQGVVSLEPCDAGWVVGIEILEDRRVPSSADVLALYEVEVDSRGELTSYARRRRYSRGKSDSGEMTP
jgi:hypothetical protein